MTSQATIAEYFRIGVELGIVPADACRAWADTLIQQQGQPSGEIVEVSWSKSTQQLLDALRAFDGERNCVLAGSWLLGLLAKELKGSSHPSFVARTAGQVAQMACMGEDICFTLSVVESHFAMAELSQLGTIESCREELEAALAGYPARPAET